MRQEMIEQDETKLKAQMEEAVADLKQNDGGIWCDFDAIKGLERLQIKGFCTPGITYIRTISFSGPVFYYSEYVGDETRGNHHTVGQIGKDGWVVDLACKPGERIFRDLEDYKKRSGIRLPTNCQERIFEIPLQTKPLKD